MRTTVESSKKGVRALAASALTLAMLGVTACGTGSSGNSGLQIILTTNPWSTEIVERLSEFEEQSGIDVEVTQLTREQAQSTLTVKLKAGASDLDVYMYAPPQLGLQYAENGWMLDLTDRVTGNDEFGWDDFMPATREAVTYEDRVYGIPTVTEREVLFYRKDLFEAAGLEPPTTFEELEAAAAELEGDGVTGYIARAEPSAAITQFSGFLYGYGGDFITDGEASINTDEAIAAYQTYGDLYREHGPVGLVGTTQELVAMFQQGSAAMMIDAEVWWGQLVDPESSSVPAEDVGVAPLPGGPAGSRPYNIPSQALGINPDTSMEDEAWEFVQWATSPEMVFDIQQSGVFGARQSVWDDPEALTGIPADYRDTLLASIESGIGHDRPQVMQVGRARDIAGAPILVAIEGGDVAAAADQAQAQLEALLVEEQESAE